MDEALADDGGLTSDQAAVRPSHGGANALPAPRPQSAAALPGRQVPNPPVLVLLIAVAIAQGPGERLDAAAIELLVARDAALGSVRGWRAEEAPGAPRTIILMDAEGASILGRSGCALIALFGLPTGAASLAPFHVVLPQGETLARVTAFTGTAVFEKVSIIAFRSLRHPDWSIGRTSNRRLLLGSGLISAARRGRLRRGRSLTGTGRRIWCSASLSLASPWGG
jgi:hypothetical protein